jgi:hypothetical protein
MSGSYGSPGDQGSGARYRRSETAVVVLGERQSLLLLDRFYRQSRQRPPVRPGLGPVQRERLERLLTRHKYGLNLKLDAHFGMSVAEYVGL